MRNRLLAHAIVIAALLAIAATARAGGPYPGCEPYPITEHSPSGLVGCEAYGSGIASTWGGPGVARNDCRWPWDACTPIAIRAVETGRTIVVTPTMYCDCWLGGTGPNGEAARIVDLDPASLALLGLDPAAGLYAVTVEPVREGASSSDWLPDTAYTSMSRVELQSDRLRREASPVLNPLVAPRSVIEVEQ